LKKSALKPWLKERWGMPPAAHADLVWGMEDVLDVYQRPYSSPPPRSCRAASSQQPGSAPRQPLPAEPGRPERDDYEYERKGVSNLLMLFAPLDGWRPVRGTDRRTKVDGAHGIQDVLPVHVPEAVHVTLVMDQLKTHHPASWSEAFPPEEAQALLDGCAFHYPPTHGRWLKMAASEFSALQRPCVDRRLPEHATLRADVAAWEEQRTAQRIKVHWRFTTADARIRLERLYPSIKN
jgi:DDE superfamily endonuclease